MTEVVTSHGLTPTTYTKQARLTATLTAATPSVVSAPLLDSSHKTGSEAPTLATLDPTPVLVPPQSQPPQRPSKVLKQVKAVSLAALFLIELWSGVASLSSVLCAQGASLRAFCESNPLLHQLLSTLHPDAQSASRSEQEEWKAWQIPQAAVVWVLGGPSCTSLSTAGKQLAGKDPTSRYLFDHLVISAALGASLILLENVLYLVEGDIIYGLYSQLVQQAAALGYVLVQQLKVEESRMGGSTQRARVFLTL